ncbi:MAG: LamG domain-containing protein [Cyanobacteria bacterium P01_D01_bin.115]
MNLYGWVLLLAGVAHFPWVRTLVSLHGRQSRFAIATGLPLNEWSHIAGTYDGKSIRLYINGELGAETCYESAPLELTKSDFWLGNHRQNTRPYAGYLKDIQLWQRILTSAEIQQAIVQAPLAEAAGPLASWPFAKATSDVAIADQVQKIPVTRRNATAPQTAAGGPQVVQSP